ncbi:MAG: pantetheine-phosphate adenylyltransferase [Coriobacteriales bacterium]
MRKVIVPGTFDPITNGHLEVVERSSRLFDQVVVAVALSQKKNGRGTLFSLDERVELARAVTAHLDNVEVLPFEGLLVDFAQDLGACALVKGLRATTDFEYEFQMAALNYRQAPQLETVFVTASPDNTYISSSIIKELASMGGKVEGMVPPLVEEALKSKFPR